MEVANYLSIELTTKKGCGICERLFQCNVPYIANEVKFLEDLKHWIPPDFSVVEKITLEDLDSYEKTLIGEGGLKKNDVEDSILELINDNNFPSTFPQSEILDKKKNIEISATENLKELLLFFKLEKIEDIFDSQDDIVDCSINSDTTIICSDIELKSVECEAEYPLSPILSTQLTPRKQEVEDDELGSPVLRPRETFKSLKDRTINSRCSLDIIDSSLEDINSSKSAKRGFQIEKNSPPNEKIITDVDHPNHNFSFKVEFIYEIHSDITVKNNISISSDVQNIATKSKSIEKAQNTSILDDLRNFEDFNQSFNLTKPSPFKKPEIRKHCYKNNQQKKLQSKTNLASCSKLNGTNLGTDSDDEFDYIPNVSSSLSRMNRSAVIENNSDDEFETTFYGTGKQKESLKSQMHLKVLEKKTKVKKKRSDFIEEEADVSSDALTISDDENSADDGSYDESFVDDETQALANDTQMHVRYLQSVKSPQAGPKFKIPAIPKPITSDIFSQPVNPEEFNSYINDSFCVNSQDVESEAHELSELEILEKN
ncbi:hypothetical protein HHI36_002093 [Cryptolaemus montrouzieri]|uniref:Uncharacterized protein n=1 Tax=Cryptolaemus montrouzieri TaxID=559131 RepID=A0ABD2P9K6_9CUCU